MTRISPDEALPQCVTALQRRLVQHLSTRPGWSMTDRLTSELVGHCVPSGIDRMRYQETKKNVTSAMRRLQHIGFVRYDADTGGWVR